MAEPFIESLFAFHMSLTNSDLTGLDELVATDNTDNIIRGCVCSSSPEEEIIRHRGRKRCSDEDSKPKRRKEEIAVFLATRKSPRKPPKPVDFSAYFFRSPTPNKNPPKSATPKKEPSPSLLKARINFRKRLSLNIRDVTPLTPTTNGHATNARKRRSKTDTTSSNCNTPTSSISSTASSQDNAHSPIAAS